MPVKADEKYDAKVLDVFLSESKNQRTPEIYFLFETADGQIDHHLYITPKTVERAKETMQDCFHVSPEEVVEMSQSGDWSKIKGQSISITTVSEEYNDKPVVRVQWMNAARFRPAKAQADTTKLVANLFSGQSTMSAPNAAPLNWEAPITDDDVPF